MVWCVVLVKGLFTLFFELRIQNYHHESSNPVKCSFDSNLYLFIIPPAISHSFLLSITDSILSCSYPLPIYRCSQYSINVKNNLFSNSKCHACYLCILAMIFYPLWIETLFDIVIFRNWQCVKLFDAFSINLFRFPMQILKLIALIQLKWIPLKH